MTGSMSTVLNHAKELFEQKKRNEALHYLHRFILANNLHNLEEGVDECFLITFNDYFVLNRTLRKNTPFPELEERGAELIQKTEQIFTTDVLELLDKLGGMGIEEVTVPNVEEELKIRGMLVHKKPHISFSQFIDKALAFEKEIESYEEKIAVTKLKISKTAPEEVTNELEREKEEYEERLRKARATQDQFMNTGLV